MPSPSSSKQLSILAVEDDAGDALLLRAAAVGLSQPPTRIVQLPSVEDALARLGQEAFDLIISDLGLPGCSDIDACVRLRAAAPETPLIVLTGNEWDEMGGRAIHAGAQDYLSKGDLTRVQLHRTVRHALERHRLVLGLRAAERAAESDRESIALAYARLEQAERLRVDLTNMIIHDLRTPLTGIRSYLELALRRTPPTGEVKAYLTSGYDACSSLGDLIDTLLDLHRLESGDVRLLVQRSEVSEVVDEAVRSARASHPDVIVEVSGPPLVAAWDRDLMRRVLANLLDNAAKHTPEGKPIAATWTTDDRDLVISVADRGAGIAPEHHARIFEKFGCVDLATRGRRSTGLGLPFCRLVVEAHGGSIGVESSPGNGSRFSLRIPLGAAVP